MCISPEISSIFPMPLLYTPIQKINDIIYYIVTFNKTLFDTKHIQIKIYINLINCTQT